MRITDIAYQNRVANQLVDLADVMPEYISAYNPDVGMAKDPKTGKTIPPITVLVDGQKKILQRASISCCRNDIYVTTRNYRSWVVVK